MMSSEDEEIFDVICIGAGFSGLTAAYTLFKAKPGLKVCVLEAKDRVGGRVLSKKLKCANAEGKDDEWGWDFGGTWVGSKQQYVWQLLQELDVGTYKQHVTGTRCLRLDTDVKAQTYTSTFPPIGFMSNLDLAQAVFRMERVIKSMNVVEPWDHPQAAYLDSITAADLLNKYFFTSKAKGLFSVAIRMLAGVEPSQVNALFFLVGCAAEGGLLNAMDTGPGSPQEFKIKGGAQEVCIKMIKEHIGEKNVKLSTPVTKIEQTEHSVVVSTQSDKTQYQARHVIVTTPPHLTASIDFTPPLPSNMQKLCQMMPVGHLIKVIATYRQCYWRMQGYSGEVVTTDPMEGKMGPLSLVLDIVSEHGHPALMALISGKQATEWRDKHAEERRAAVLKSLSEHFQITELLDPIDYVEKDWSQEPYNGGCPGSIVPPGAMEFYRQLGTSVHSRVEFAGTELSEEGSGYIDGAVHTGIQAANKILEKLTADEI